jgi:hypothetical protein
MDAICVLFSYGWMPFVVGLAADGCHPLAYGSSLLACGFHPLVNFCLHKNSNDLLLSVFMLNS